MSATHPIPEPLPALRLLPGANSEPAPGFWVLLWSQSQCCFHVECLEDMLASNRRAYRDDYRMDYVPIVIADRDLVETTATKLRGTLALRQAQRPSLSTNLAI